MKKNVRYLQNKKNVSPVTMVTAYDYPTAQIEDEAGIDVVLVGDSVGTNILGYKSEQEVTMSDMLHHLSAVSRAVQYAYVLADMPYGSAQDPFLAFENARQLIGKGADCVKIEGWREKKNIVSFLTEKGIDVCGHIGYNPQVHTSPKTFGKDAPQAIELIESAKILEKSGAVMLIVEKIPQEIAAIVTSELKIPVIGIGSGIKCDGQVLVVNDILGWSSRVFRHVHKYADFRSLARKAIKDYKNDIERGVFPSEQNLWHIPPEELREVLTALS